MGYREATTASATTTATTTSGVIASKDTLNASPQSSPFHFLMSEEKQCWPQKEVRTTLIVRRLQSSVLNAIHNGTVNVHLIFATFNLCLWIFFSSPKT